MAYGTPQPTLFEVDQAKWIGWRRARGQRWKAVSEGRTEREASERLLDVASREKAGAFDSMTLPAGEKP